MDVSLFRDNFLDTSDKHKTSTGRETVSTIKKRVSPLCAWVVTRYNRKFEIRDIVEEGSQQLPILEHEEKIETFSCSNDKYLIFPVCHKQWVIPNYGIIWDFSWCFYHFSSSGCLLSWFFKGLVCCSFSKRRWTSVLLIWSFGRLTFRVKESIDWRKYMVVYVVIHLI